MRTKFGNVVVDQLKYIKYENTKEMGIRACSECSIGKRVENCERCRNFFLWAVENLDGAGDIAHVTAHADYLSFRLRAATIKKVCDC